VAPSKNRLAAESWKFTLRERATYERTQSCNSGRTYLRIADEFKIKNL